MFATTSALKTICKALRSHGGAVSEYEATAKQLGVLHAIVGDAQILRTSLHTINTRTAALVDALCG